jgi:hypothetical protein
MLDTLRLGQNEGVVPCVEGKGGVDGWSLGLGVEVVRDSAFAGVGLDDPKKDHSSHLDYHSRYAPPLLVSIAFPRHITRSIRLHYPPLLLSASSSLEWILQREFDSRRRTWKKQI